MNFSTPDYIAVLVYFGGLLVLASFLRMRSTNFADFAVAKRSVPAILVFSSLSATFIGPGYSIALTTQSFESGLLYFLIFSFFSLQTAFTSIFLSPKLRAFEDCMTLGDVLASGYGEPARIISGIISVLVCIGFTSIMALAGGQILISFLDLPLVFCMLLVTLIGCLYAATGGLKAVIITESIQLVIILVAISTLLLIAGFSISDFKSLERGAIHATSQSWSNLGLISFLGLALSFFFGEMLIPPYANRALAGSSSKVSKQGFFYTAIFSLAWFFAITLLGIFALSILGPNQDPESALLGLADTLLPPGLKGVLLVALAAIVMSTQESVINAGSTIFVNDLARGRLTNDKKRLDGGRLTAIVIAVLGFCFAYFVPSVISLLLISYAIWAPSVAVPLAWLLLGLPINKSSGVLAMSFGAAFSTAAAIGIPNSSDNGIAILIGLVGTLSGAFIGLVLNKFSVKKIGA